jgi:hypothetical protein
MCAGSQKTTGDGVTVTASRTVSNRGQSDGPPRVSHSLGLRTWHFSADSRLGRPPHKKMPGPMGNPGSSILKGYKLKLAKLPEFVVADETQLDFEPLWTSFSIGVSIPRAQGRTPSDRT